MEEWKQVSEFENYYVSNLGRVYNCVTKKFIGNKISGKYEYAKVKLRNSRGIRLVDVHRLVAETFIPNPESKAAVNHINGIKSDNRVENLEWVSYSENCTHAFTSGLKTPKRGEKSERAKLTQNQVEYIRSHYKSYDREFGGGALGKMFNVSERTIRDCVNNRTWQTEYQC